MDQRELAAAAATAMVDLAPKKSARQLDFTAGCRVSANAMLPEQHQLHSVLQSQSQPQSHQPQLPSQALPQSQPQPWLHAVPVVQSRSHPVTREALPVLNPESPKPRGNIEVKDGTPVKKKQCNCTRSRCLKLYCECFASGSYCDGCNCIDCYNNVEHEVARERAIGTTLERNPNAFRPKIANSPLGSRGGRVEAGEIATVGKHNKGCHCKKSGCLKKYCECFQAGIMCSENCRCVDCKNFEASEDRRAIFHGEHANSMVAANAAISGAIGASGYGTPPAFKKRKTEELSATTNNQSIHRTALFQQEHPLRACAVAASSALSTPVSRTANTVLSGPLKSTYRSPLADIVQLQDVKELCSLLVVASGEVAKALAERDEVETSIAPLTQEGENGQKEDDSQIAAHLIGKQDDTAETSNSELDGVDMENGRPMSPGTLALLCDEQDPMFTEAISPIGISNHGQNMNPKSSRGQEFTKVYVEQERLSLTRLWDFLNRVVTCGSIKEMMCSQSGKTKSRSQQEPVESETRRDKEANDDIVETLFLSTPPSQAAVSVSEATPSPKVGFPNNNREVMTEVMTGEEKRDMRRNGAEIDPAFVNTRRNGAEIDPAFVKAKYEEIKKLSMKADELTARLGTRQGKT